jgi:glutaredoxin
MIRLTLYTRPGCHLCDTMKGVVDELAREQPITLREVDITGDHGLERRFGTEIPVLTCGTRVIASVRATRAALIEALRGDPNS